MGQNKLAIFLLIVIFLSACTEDLKPRYKFENGKGIVAEVLSSNFHYYLVFKNSDNKALSKFKVGIGTMESDISSAMWDPSKNHFALKISGEGKQTFIYTYDVGKKEFKKYHNPSQKDIPKWIGFSVKPGFNLPEDINIDKYEQ